MITMPTFQKMSRKLGQREHERFSILGATVSWRNMDQTSFPAETWPLSDISSSGVSLLTNNPPDVDSDISLRINLPKKPEHIELYGRVIYSIFRGPGLTYEYRIGIQLNPFSTTEGDNSSQAREAIEKLERMYGKKLETQDIED